MEKDQAAAAIDAIIAEAKRKPKTDRHKARKRMCRKENGRKGTSPYKFHINEN